MFTGIIETVGTLEEVHENGGNRSFLIRSALAAELKVDQSLAHNGICLTVEKIDKDLYQVTAVAETLAKTNAGQWKKGDQVNLERAMTMNARLDGHMVQGHVDAVAICTDIEEMDGSWKFTFSFPEKFRALMIEKGSVSVNGISLTAFEVGNNQFSVAIIPFTWEHTNLNRLQKGQQVNIEFDMIGKYIQRHIQVLQLNIGK
ncbi:MAG TPA: riboflavin synthase [Chitinophagaceae bacterium]|nr:riboflavin synthase [Chitinophagaceae bacterium]